MAPPGSRTSPGSIRSGTTRRRSRSFGSWRRCAFNSHFRTLSARFPLSFLIFFDSLVALTFAFFRPLCAQFCLLFLGLLSLSARFPLKFSSPLCSLLTCRSTRARKSGTSSGSSRGRSVSHFCSHFAPLFSDVRLTFCSVSAPVLLSFAHFLGAHFFLPTGREPRAVLRRDLRGP